MRREGLKENGINVGYKPSRIEMAREKLPVSIVNFLLKGWCKIGYAMQCPQMSNVLEQSKSRTQRRNWELEMETHMEKKVRLRLRC